MVGLHRLEEEDPGLRVRQDDEAHQTVLTVMGDTHLAVVLERLKRKYAVEVDVEERRHSYRRTIQQGRGGRGPAQEADRRPRPVRRRAPARRAAPARRGLRVRRRGRRRRDPPTVHPRGPARRREGDGVGRDQGIPFVDIRVICDDGKHHSVDSSEAAFEMAGSIAFHDAVAAAGTVVLEPVSHLEVDVPTRFLGDVLSDLNSRRGRVVSSDPDDDGQTRVVALVPDDRARPLHDGPARDRGRPRHVPATFDHFASCPRTSPPSSPRADAADARVATVSRMDDGPRLARRDRARGARCQRRRLAARARRRRDRAHRGAEPDSSTPSSSSCSTAPAPRRAARCPTGRSAACRSS